jgi:hypothetical protein
LHNEEGRHLERKILAVSGFRCTTEALTIDPSSDLLNPAGFDDVELL